MTTPPTATALFRADPELWTRLHRWTPAEALSAPGRSAQRAALARAAEDTSVRSFLAGLPDDRSRVIAVSNAFGPNLIAEDIAEFLSSISCVGVYTSEVEAVLNAPDVPATRTEVAEVAAAVRDLTRTLDSVLGELGSRVTAVEKVLDDGMANLADEVSEVCTELAEIGGALKRLPRPAERDGWMPQPFPEPDTEPEAELDGWMPLRRWLRRRGGGRR
jgi:hypothetical protein